MVDGFVTELDRKYTLNFMMYAQNLLKIYGPNLGILHTENIGRV